MNHDDDYFLHARGPGCAILVLSWITMLAAGFAFGWVLALAVLP